MVVSAARIHFLIIICFIIYKFENCFIKTILAKFRNDSKHGQNYQNSDFRNSNIKTCSLYNTCNFNN